MQTMHQQCRDKNNSDYVTLLQMDYTIKLLDVVYTFIKHMKFFLLYVNFQERGEILKIKVINIIKTVIET